LLLCKQTCCCWHLVYIKLAPDDEADTAATQERDMMSKTASIALNSSSTLFGRFLAAIDRLLMTSARIAVRNGDLPRFGL
jgi:hypothetical protein